MIPLFRLEGDGWVYYDEILSGVPREVQDKVIEWEEAIKVRESFQTDPYYVMFEGELEPVYENDQYIEARQEEMNLFGDIVEMSAKYNITNLIEHLICR